MKEILKDYQVNCPEKENFELQVHELGIILKEVFPDVERVQRRVNGSRSWQYPLAKIANFQQSAAVTDVINWEDLPPFVNGLGWQLSSSCSEFMEWIKIRSQDLCEGNRVLQEIKIFNDWTFTVICEQPGNTQRHPGKSRNCAFKENDEVYVRRSGKFQFV